MTQLQRYEMEYLICSYIEIREKSRNFSKILERKLWTESGGDVVRAEQWWHQILENSRTKLLDNNS